MLFLFVVFPFFCYGLVQATPCTTSSDCQTDECCVTLNQPRGRRSLAPPGSCHKLGVAGARCLANPHLHQPTNGLYYSCPCASNHYCSGTGLYEAPLGEIGMCHANKTLLTSVTLGQSCSRGSLCAPTECCVSAIRPIGKRFDLGLSRGHCKAMGTAGSHCFVNGGSGKPDQMAFACPCSRGLTCHGSGTFDIPLGETGFCH